MKTPSKVMLGLSGGVDSAVSACLLLEQGFQVQPVLMHNWQNDPNCTIEDDLKDCQAICNHMVLELDIVNFQDLYRERVFDYCLKLFQQGLTPNPDILCNSQIKFEAEGCSDASSLLFQFFEPSSKPSIFLQFGQPPQKPEI